ncbi:hypothetical protein KPH14_007348 [Odynerus spinipes]|uniref:Uncharacterized protein n=1 Tax=Odynerus spinipes TaxID=1348599 RepID=A0AAD9VIM8_9HYME|nr:hypothetical protein KPH14_007348 [Odynerus spinipes]
MLPGYDDNTKTRSPPEAGYKILKREDVGEGEEAKEMLGGVNDGVESSVSIVARNLVTPGVIVGTLQPCARSLLDYESPACKADMAEGSAEEEQSSTAAPASPPADLRTLNTQLSPPYHHQPHLQLPRLQHLQHPNMLATAVPPRHSHSMLSHQVKTEAELDAAYDVPLNLKSEVSFDESTTTKLSTLLV